MINMFRKKEWNLVSASVTGNSHIENDIPCQDAHKIKKLNHKWGIAVTADGAGSFRYSHLGSRETVEIAIQVFTDLIEREQWIQKKEIPTEETWKLLAKSSLKTIRDKLKEYADENELDFSQIGCTLIVVIYTPYGLLVTHVGDGRAGYLNDKNEWLAAIDPFEGDEVGTTVFINLNIWNNDEFIESRIIKDKVKAFTLMSDGCESISWQTVQLDKKNKKFVVINKPFPDFFNNSLNVLKKMKKSKLSDKEVNEKWANYLTNGHPKLIEERDDKTMILAYIND
jgi:hypothetical protein